MYNNDHGCNNNNYNLIVACYSANERKHITLLFIVTFISLFCYCCDCSDRSVKYVVTDKLCCSF